MECNLSHCRQSCFRFGSIVPLRLLPVLAVLFVPESAVAGAADALPARASAHRPNLLPDPDSPGKRIGDPETFIYKLRSGDELTPEEASYVELFRRQRGWDRREVADHLEELLAKNRFLDFRERERQARIRRWNAVLARRDVRLGTLGVFAALGVAVILTDLLRLRAGRWLRERRLAQGEAAETAEDLLAEVRSGSTLASPPGPPASDDRRTDAVDG